MSDERVTSSCYLIADSCLVPLRTPSAAPDPLAQLIHGQFRGMILSDGFPCLGGAGAFRRGDYRFAVYGPLASAAATRECADDLSRFVSECPAADHPVAAFVATFHGPLIPTELEFEQGLWQQLQGLSAHEPASPQRTTPSASVDADDPGFFFRGREFFVVGLHPASSRWARRFAWPTLVFNALTHSDELRRAGKYERMQERILARDRSLQGSDNPSLPCSQQSQFSGRRVDAGWRCPVDDD